MFGYIFKMPFKIFVPKHVLAQGYQTQSVLRAACDWKQGLAGHIKKLRKNFKLISNVFEKMDQLAQ